MHDKKITIFISYPHGRNKNRLVNDRKDESRAEQMYEQITYWQPDYINLLH